MSAKREGEASESGVPRGHREARMDDALVPAQAGLSAKRNHDPKSVSRELFLR